MDNTNINKFQNEEDFYQSGVIIDLTINDEKDEGQADGNHYIQDNDEIIDLTNCGEKDEVKADKETATHCDNGPRRRQFARKTYKPYPEQNLGKYPLRQLERRLVEVELSIEAIVHYLEVKHEYGTTKEKKNEWKVVQINIYYDIVVFRDGGALHNIIWKQWRSNLCSYKTKWEKIDFCLSFYIFFSYNYFKKMFYW